MTRDAAERRASGDSTRHTQRRNIQAADFYRRGDGYHAGRSGDGRGADSRPYQLTDPDMVQGIHEEFLRAGCDIVTANTFGANPLKLPGQTRDVITAGIDMRGGLSPKSEASEDISPATSAPAAGCFHPWEIFPSRTPTIPFARWRGPRGTRAGPSADRNDVGHIRA
jgi:hypothetical protein